MNRPVTRPEILAPVGGREQLLAAVRAGADAVYFGGKGFNARRNAGTTTDDAFSVPEAVAYCHGRSVRVYMTVNTIVMDDEKDQWKAQVDEIAACGVDGVMVQDLAVARYIRETYPALPMFASTQMAVHNLEGVRILEKLGFKRAVMARELTLDEIRTIARGSRIEVETFIHGAHCMSLSGGCTLSAMIGGRSGNRGLCAQPCRLNFVCKGREYALSLKDMCCIEQIHALADAGVCCFKIEGRMKRPEYVAAAVTAYRKALDGEPYDGDLKALEAVFSRSGFTDGYLTGKRDVHMFGTRTKEDVAASSAVLGQLAQLYRSERQTIAVDMLLTAGLGVPTTLTVTDGEHWATAEGPAAEEALQVPMTKASLRKNLEKTGGTPFCLHELTCQFEGALAVPASAVNAMRRQALEDLLAQRSQLMPLKRRERTSVSKEEEAREKAAVNQNKQAAPVTPAQIPVWRLRVETTEQYRALRKAAEEAGRKAAGCEGAPGEPAYQWLVPLRVLKAHPEILQEHVDRGTADSLLGELPSVHFPADTPRLEKTLQELRGQGLTRLLTEDYGGLEMGLRYGFRVSGGSALNVVNTDALKGCLELGMEDVTVSFELSMSKIKALGGTGKRGYVAYGYLPLMKFRTCPARTEKGCEGCSGCTPMVDRKGETFTVLCREKRYSELLNCVPLYIGDKPLAAADFITLYFTTETPEECVSRALLLRGAKEPPFRRTNGLYWRELL